MWEAQFGDFATTCQVTIDTYFASGESKWGLQSALTLLLPHGFGAFAWEFGVVADLLTLFGVV